MVKSRNITEKAYLEVNKYRDLVTSDIYRDQFHLMPPVGLINDPNGLIQFKGTYHIFYQWNPFETEHGIKFWGHYSTKDFLKWTIEPIALSPDEWYDKNGCYSGSAVEHDEKLYLFYTGNVKGSNDERLTYQCMAISEDGIQFDKKGPLIYLPEGYTSHFRDPKVWKANDSWYMILGAQNSKLEGNAILYKSDNLIDWKFLGSIAGSGMNGLGEFGYMWECPDLFTLGGVDVLLVSPQGLPEQGILYNNEFQSVYFLGKMDYSVNKFEHQTFTELDRGFDFYAPQTMLDDKGRRILIAWLGMSDEFQAYQPTIGKNWLHMLTIPRELKLVDGLLYQTPIEELTQLRAQQLTDKSIELNEGQKVKWHTDDCKALELKLDMISDTKGLFEMSIQDNIKIIYNSIKSTMTLERWNFKGTGKERRHCILKKLSNLHIFIDSSSIEIFVNDGEEVFTARFFADPANKSITFKSETDLKFAMKTWKLKAFEIEG